MRNQRIQCKPCYESTDNWFNSGYFREKSGKKHNGQYKNIMGMFLTFQFFEKPFRNSRNNYKHNRRENSQRNTQSNPKRLIQTTLTIPDNHCQNNQDRRIGQNSSSHRNGDRLIFGHAQFADNRISHQRMGGKHTCRQKTGIEIIVQKMITYRETYGYRNYKSQKTKN